MEEEQKEKEYEFINEIIIPKKKNKWLARLETLGVVIVMAVVFGFVARWVFLNSDKSLQNLLRMEERKTIELNNVTPIIKAEITNSLSITDTDKTIEKEQNSLLQKYEEIRKVYEEVSPCIAIIEIVEESVGLFEEPYEVKKWTTGLIVADDGVDLLILTDVRKLSENSSIIVYLGNSKVSGRIYSKASAYDLAVIAIDKKYISQRVYNKIEFAKFMEDDIEIGTPVIALGGPNGYKNSIEQGMVNSLGDTIFVTDGVLSYFTTDITDYENGNGFVFNLDGEVMGMITHAYENEIQTGVCAVITLKEITGVLEGLLNTWKNVMFGITGYDFSKDIRVSVEGLKYNDVLKILGNSKGVYVTKVENNSPAMKAGIKPGDIILGIDKRSVEGIRELMQVLPEFSVGYVTTVNVISILENKVLNENIRIKLGEKE